MYKENSANLGLFVIHKIVSECAERIYVCTVHGEDAKRQSADILVNNGLTINFLCVFTFLQDGLN